MILTCPSCRTKYVVPDSAIGLDGRKVRCAQCRFSWFQDGPEQMATGITPPPAPPPPAPPPAPRKTAPPPPPPTTFVDESVAEEAPPAEPIDWAPAEPVEEYEEPRRARRNPARLWTWVAVVSALLMVGALTAIYFVGPDRITAWMNGGVATSADEALRFTRRDLSREPLPTDRELFTVTGEITNVSSETQRVPQIRAEVTDANQNVIFAWTIAPPVDELAAGQATTFASSSTDVPRGGRSLSLRFGTGN